MSGIDTHYRKLVYLTSIIKVTHCLAKRATNCDKCGDKNLILKDIKIFKHLKIKLTLLWDVHPILLYSVHFIVIQTVNAFISKGF